MRRLYKQLIRLTNDFQTPNAVPIRRSVPTRTGMEAVNVSALVERAKDDSRMGPSGWTLVRPIRAKTIM